jgi:hypothetical protein
VALGFIFNLLSSCLNIFSFPVSTAKLIGDFYNNKRSTANSCLRFTYSFVSLMLHQYYWSCHSYSANRQSTANKKMRENFLLVLQICPALPMGMANIPRFARKRRGQRSANNLSYG